MLYLPTKGPPPTDRFRIGVHVRSTLGDGLLDVAGEVVEKVLRLLGDTLREGVAPLPGGGEALCHGVEVAGISLGDRCAEGGFGTVGPVEQDSLYVN